MPTDRQILKNAQSGHINSAALAVDPLTQGTGAVAALNTRYYSFPMTDNGAILGVATESAIRMPVAGKVVSIAVSPAIAVTANNSNFATFTVSKRTGAGGAVTVGTQTTAITGMGNLAAFVPYVFATADFTAANVNVAAGDVLTCLIGKTGAGIILTTAISATVAANYVMVTVGIEEV